MAGEDDFLGRGWAFPPSFSKTEKTNTMVSAEKDIQESLMILLTTTIGERFLQPEFGCDLGSYLFESIDVTTKNVIKDKIRTAIIYYEARIELDQVRFIPAAEPGEGRLNIEITYTVRATNSRFNIVIPYYELTGGSI